MSMVEKFIEEYQKLNEEQKREVINFIEFLKYKEEKEDASIITKVITENEKALKELRK